MRKLGMLRSLAVAVAGLITIATGMGAALASAPAALTAAEAALIRGGSTTSGDCNAAQTTLHGCINTDACDGSLATGCNGSCAGSCVEAGAWTDNYGNGSQKKADTDCGNEVTGATCTKITPKNSDPFCGCLNGMDS